MPAAGRPHLLCLCSTSIVRHLWMKPSDLKEGIPLTSQSLTLLNLNGVHHLVNFINLSTFDVNALAKSKIFGLCLQKKETINPTSYNDTRLSAAPHNSLFFSGTWGEKHPGSHNSFSLFIDTLWKGGQLNYHAWFFPRIILQHNDLKK